MMSVCIAKKFQEACTLDATIPSSYKNRAKKDNLVPWLVLTIMCKKCQAGMGEDVKMPVVRNASHWPGMSDRTLRFKIYEFVEVDEW